MKYLNNSKDFDSEYSGVGPFQITYNFSKAVRSNLFSSRSTAKAVHSLASQAVYGESGWSFRALYEFLCDYFNGGYPFIDTYFGQVFKTRPVYQRFLTIYSDIQEDIAEEQFGYYQTLPLNKDNTPNKSYSVSKRFKDFRVWQDPIVRMGCRRVADEIRGDIINCLVSGRIPMSHKPGKSGSLGPTSVSLATAKVRERLAGMNHPTRLFFASGQLISNLNIYVEITKGANKEGRAA